MAAEEVKGEPVYLNVYSGGKWNCLLNFFGVGIYHTGVKVYKVEYWYGGHSDNSTGIMRTYPGEINLRLEESILIGHTMMSNREVLREISFLDKMWLGSEYEPFSYNCNNFSKELIFRLCQVDYFPLYINRFALLKPLFKVWYTPLRTLCGDLTELKSIKSLNEVNVHNTSLYKVKKIENERDSEIVKDAADSYYMLNSYKEAIIGYEMCITARKHPKNNMEQLYISAANCCWKLAKYIDMERYMRMCIEDFPTFTTAYIKRAIALKAMKKFEDAHKDLIKAHQLSPNDLLIQEELKKLNTTQKLLQTN